MQAAPKTRERMDFLDVARGVAAMVVLVGHGLQACFAGYSEFLTAYFDVGQAAVILFFMVSSYVIPISLETSHNFAGFWVRRFFRLFPVYWTSILFAFVSLGAGFTYGVGVALDDTKNWLLNLALLQGCLNRPNIWGPFWSLHYEVGLYIVFSLLFTLGILKRMGPRASVLLLVAFAVGGGLWPLVTGRPPGEGGLRMVVMAVLFGYLARHYVEGRVGARAFYALCAGQFLAILLIEAIHYALVPSAAAGVRLLRYGAVMGLSYGGFVAFVEARRAVMPRGAIWLGQVSYPIYLMHPFVMCVLAPTLSSAGWGVYMIGLVCLTLGLAALVHYVVELPGIQLGRYIERRLAPRSRTEATVEIRRAA
jgi:peptidoglycan/LPS O-acetylase OafA/YrhL